MSSILSKEILAFGMSFFLFSCNVIFLYPQYEITFKKHNLKHLVLSVSTVCVY